MVAVTKAVGDESSANESVTVFNPNDTTAPTVALTSPGDKAALSGPSDIAGTIVDSNAELVSWKLEVAPHNGGDWKLLASDTAAAGQTLANITTATVLGKLDTTMLQNGSYIVASRRPTAAI